MAFTNLVDLEYICNLIFNLYELSVLFIDSKKKLKLEFSTNSLSHPLYSRKEELLNQFFSDHAPHQFPIFQTTTSLENFFSINLYTDKGFSGVIIVGPFLYFELTDKSIHGILNDFNIYKGRNKIVQYYHSLPVVSRVKMINMSAIFYYMLYHQKLDIVDILQQNILLVERKIRLESPDIRISETQENDENNETPAPLLLEKTLLQFIKEGKKDEFLKHAQALFETGELRILSKTSQLRSRKNHAIAAITLGTRAAIEGGISPETAYTLSKLYIQNLEELKESKAIYQFMIQALCDLIEEVEKGNELKYSKTINACRNYIFTHLYEEITLSQLAEFVSMHPNYLSVLFKKEVGVSLREYIQREKIEEAKKLIFYTKHSMSEIYTLLHFYDQSYFIKVFKKFTGMTPRQFKNKGVKM
ncbi:AraC family transcriptional regulator [Bacillus cereus]|uniref:helix-turn-helix domain-containing protein n=1 Tax=Bacillus sp. AFS023182 TaxID=2033492 RepID=UPI000BF858A1|nr:helix-turn-helix domain-containing protein [Bacillus sp. AFS023182]PFD97851.1 AraC family transcriptional regulator [Bacillus sp. AFS023182]PGX95035.1 AraC family transcriptional regulator [Bacillus cereus]